MDYIIALDVLNKKVKVPKNIKKNLERWRDVYYDISLHTTGTCPYWFGADGFSKVYPKEYVGEEYQWRFDYRLMNRHPNEPQSSRWYRYSIYRPLTKAPFNRAIQVFSGAIFQDSNYSIEINNEIDRNYIFGNNFYGFDLMGYFANIGFKNIVEDPNGLFIRMPDKPYYEQIGERVTISIRFINTKDIIYFDKDALIFRTPDCEYAYYVDKETIWRFTLDRGKYVLSEDDNEGYYAHMLGYIPVSVAGGEWNTHGHFDSYLDAAKALCDEFISTFSAAQVVDKEASHPYIQAAQEDCPDCKGLGEVNGCNVCGNSETTCACDGDYTRFGLRRCNTCGGTGHQSRNPMQWIKVEPKDMDKDAIKYHSPDIGINKHHREVVKQLGEDILKSLHIYRADKSESGEAKAIDQEQLYQFLVRISNHIFDHIIYDTIRDISGYRNIRVDNGNISPESIDFTIIKPNQFSIKTTADLLDDYGKGKDNGMPDIIRERMASDFAEKAYSGDNVLIKKMKASRMIDVLFVKTIDEIVSMRVLGGVTTEDVTLHDRLPNILDRIIEDKGEKWFVDASISDIETLAKSMIPVNNGLPQSTTGSTGLA